MALCEFMSVNKWLYEEALITFFENDLMQKLPEGWLDALSAENVPLSDLTCSLAQYAPSSIWPSSLQRFLEQCRELAMPRNADLALRPVASNSGLSVASITELDPVLCIGMKHKKIHEVAHLSNVIHDLCGDFSNVVDVGSGKGYIAQALSHHFGYHVIGLEGNEGQHDKAAARFTKTEERRQARRAFSASPSASSSPVSASESSSRGVSTVNFFLEYANQAEDLDFLVAPSLVEPISSLCLMSLHACGDLSPILLHLYSQWQRADTLVNVACCYHKMDCSGRGFPMSAFVSRCLRSGSIDLKPHSHWLEMATGCPRKWQAMDARALELRINKLAFRAVLERLFRVCLAEDPTVATGEYANCIIHVQKMRSELVYERFEEYLKVAIPRCKLKRNRADTQPIPASQVTTNWDVLQKRLMERATQVYEQYEPQRRAMKVWLALESCMASVAESLVLFDRWQFLEEVGREAEESSAQTGNETAEESPRPLDAPITPPSSSDFVIVPWIVPVFDQEESPRNLALIATKVSKKGTGFETFER